MSMITTLSENKSATQDASNSALPHVLLVIDQFAKTLGGGERIVLKLASRLPRYGYRVSILTFSANPESAALQSPPCPIYLLSLRRTYDFHAMRAAFALRRFLKEQRIQIVQTFFESSDIWAGFVTKTMSDAKLIWSRRDMGILRGRKHHIAYRRMSGLPDRVFAVSEQVRRHCIDVDGIEASRVQTIYNGLDLADWTSVSKPAKRDGDFLVTTVGNVRRVKGHDVLIKAAASVVKQFPGVVFSIAGEVLEPGYFEELKGLIHDLDLTEHVRFAGNITNLREYLFAADLFVLPSRSEGFSNAIVEAMAASLPVVATNVGGNAEAVEEGISGLIIPSQDPEALAAAIICLLSDRSLAHEMGTAGRKLVTERFTTDAMMQEITLAYAEVLTGKGTTRRVPDFVAQ
ncbi:MAG TPA: glycosyltransferase family 4 protein [Edaphobacter sp.]|jgi:glycosyltransferase involved in cell wall biosynthesis|nr:glycosyltransferase family 4 protein [Edaphobacter sp.]